MLIDIKLGKDWLIRIQYGIDNFDLRKTCIIKGTINKIAIAKQNELT
jgi:hypothetical protein